MSLVSDAEFMPADEPSALAEKRPPRRDADLLGRRDSPLRRRLEKLADTIAKGFHDQSERSDAQMDYWDAYNCVLNSQQFYDGDAQIFIPIIRDAIEARATRFVNQLFPPGGRYVEAVATDGTQPFSIIALIDHYIRAGKLDTLVAKALVRNGDIEGHYNICIDWVEWERQIVSRQASGPQAQIAGQMMQMPGEDVVDIVSEDITEGMPVIEVLHDSDVLVMPASADTLSEALHAGGMAVIARRWSKSKLEQMIERDDVRGEEGDALLEEMEAGAKGHSENRDVEKKLAEDVGIQKKGAEAVVWEVWTMLPLDGDGIDKPFRYSEKGERRLCRVYFGPGRRPLGCVRNPNWNDCCPLLSEPVQKISGVFKGKSPVEPIISLQYEANDAANEGADAAHYAAAPVVFRDPSASSQPIILNIGAIIDVPPNSVQFAQFPDLTPRAMTRIQYCTQAIFQSLGVNPSMLPQQTSSSRRNQAQVAQEQQVDLLTTAEAVRVLSGILSDAVAWFVDLDYQHRDADLAVRAFGEMGERAKMEAVPPLQNRDRYEFRWWGNEAARNAQQQQQQIGWLNVAQSLMPVLQQQGYELDIAPVLEASAGAVFGPRMAPLVLKNIKSKLSMDPQLENELLATGFELPTHALDEDQQHMQAHQQVMQMGDPTGVIRVHMMRHVAQMKMKQQAQMQQAMQQQMAGRDQPGPPPGRPQPGATPGQPRPAKGPPGMIHRDRMPMAGALPMPRKT